MHRLCQQGSAAVSWLPPPEGRSFFPDPFRVPAGAVSGALWKKLPHPGWLVDNAGTARPMTWAP